MISTYYDVVDYGQSFGSSPAGQEIQNELNNAITAALLGDKSPEEALKDAQKAAMRLSRDWSEAPPGPEGEDKGESHPSWTARRVAVKRIGTGTDPKLDQVAVEGPLQPGQSVITLGQQELRDGSPVLISTARAASGEKRRGA